MILMIFMNYHEEPKHHPSYSPLSHSSKILGAVFLSSELDIFWFHR